MYHHLSRCHSQTARGHIGVVVIVDLAVAPLQAKARGTMTTWQHHCDYMKARGTCDEVMIVSADKAEQYASAPENFKLREYKAMVIDEETYEEKETTINEAVNIVRMIEKASGKGGPGVGPQGLRLNSGKKQMLIREFQDDTSKEWVIYGKIPKGGCCVAAAGKVIVIGTFSEAKGQTAGDCNDTIELYARYLATSTWPDGSEGTAQSTPEQAKRTWQPFADLLLIGKGDINECLICRKSDALVYASAAADNTKPCDFGLKEYETELPQEDGTDKLTTIDELGALLRLMNSPLGTRPTGGIRVNQVKYQYLRGAEDLASKCNTVYGKKSKGGVVICATASVIVVATYDELKGHSAANCGAIVSDMCGNLNRAGY